MIIMKQKTESTLYKEILIGKNAVQVFAIPETDTITVCIGKKAYASEIKSVAFLKDAMTHSEFFNLISLNIFKVAGE